MGVIKDLRQIGYYAKYVLNGQQQKGLTTLQRQPFIPLGLKNLLTGKQDVGSKAYETNVDSFAVLRKVIDLYLSVPWIVEQRTAEGWDLLEDSPIHELLERPNVEKGLTWNDIQEQQLLYLFSTGNGYMYGTKFNGSIAELDVLPSTNVQVKTSEDFFLPNATYGFELGNTKRKYNAEDIEHIKLFNPSYSTVQESFNGLSVFEVAANVIEVGNDRWEADAHLLKNRGAAGIITNKGNRDLTEPEALKIQAAFDARNAGTENFGKVNVTNKDLEFLQMSMSSSDLELVKKGVITLRAMCNVFGLDSSLFNDPANKTFNNRKEAEKAAFTNAIIPISKRIAPQHTNYIARSFFPMGNVRMRQDFSKVQPLQQDLKQEAEKDKIVMDGVNTILQMNTTTEGKEKLLVDSYGFTEDDAKLIATPGQPEQQTPVL